jgi:hypothetical protein
MVMDDASTGCTTFDETVVFLSYFNDLLDPRQQGKVTYPLDELLLCLLSVLAGAECFIEIALFGVKKRDFLRRFRPFEDGTPDHGHLGDILDGRSGPRSALIEPTNKKAPRGLAVTIVRRLQLLTQWWVRLTKPHILSSQGNRFSKFHQAGLILVHHDPEALS